MTCLSSTAGGLASLVVLAACLASPAAAQQGLSDGIEPFVEVHDDVVALTHVRVIDGTGGPTLEDSTILLRAGRIAAVGPVEDVTVPEGARILDLPGHAVIPGYVMVHEHMFYPAGRGAYNQQEFSFPKLYLAGGVTTVRTGGSRDPYGDLNLKRAVDEGRVPGPRIFVTGPYVNGTGSPLLFLNSIDGPDDARRFVRYWAAEGVTSFKAYEHLTRSELAAAVEEAHALGLKVTGHLCSITDREAADLGIDNLEHGFHQATDFVVEKELDVCPSRDAKNRSIRDLDLHGADFRELVDHLVERGVALTATFTLLENGTPGRPVAPQGALEALAPFARDLYLQGWAAVQQRPTVTDAALLAKKMALDKAFADAGGLLVAGIDPTSYGGIIPGFANQRMVELLHEAGFTAEEAIRIATRNGAVLLEVDDQLGTIEAGKLADLVVLEGDPTARIADVREVRLVFKEGIGYDPARLLAAVKGTVGLN